MHEEELDNGDRQLIAYWAGPCLQRLIAASFCLPTSTRVTPCFETKPQGLLLWFFAARNPGDSTLKEEATIREIGWNDYWNDQFADYAVEGLLPGRVTAVFSGKYEVLTTEGKGLAETTGRLRHEALYAAKRPAVGDFVAVRSVGECSYLIFAVLPRSSCLQRQKVFGDPEAQVMAANVDACLIVQSLHGDFNIARLDRYVAFALNAEVTPVVVLTKADQVAEARELTEQVRRTYPSIPVHMVSAVTGEGMVELGQQIEPGRTYVAVGSSGVGKSTLLNVLSGSELMKTATVREDDQKGRHTTTHRQMFSLPNGALFIDTPGIRELALFEYDGLDGSFQDIADLAKRCRFSDCLHGDEPGCAVRQAVADGLLDPSRLANYEKMKREESTYRDRQILLAKKVSKAKIRRNTVHYKDYVRSGSPRDWK